MFYSIVLIFQVIYDVLRFTQCLLKFLSQSPPIDSVAKHLIKKKKKNWSINWDVNKLIEEEKKRRQFTLVIVHRCCKFRYDLYDTSTVPRDYVASDTCCYRLDKPWLCPRVWKQKRAEANLLLFLRKPEVRIFDTLTNQCWIIFLDRIYLFISIFLHYSSFFFIFFLCLMKKKKWYKIKIITDHWKIMNKSS